MREQNRLPRILISGVEEGHALYTEAVKRAGGDPVWGFEAHEEFDGLLLSGGCDVNPARYGEETNGACTPDDVRDEKEIALIKLFASQNKPIFGICRGTQILNVAFGGSLIQDLPADPSHRTVNGVKHPHEVKAEPGSIFYSLYGERSVSNSFHHEAVKQVAEGFVVTARSVPDGVVEAIEHPGKPWFAVQYHPEQMCDGNPDYSDGNKLFAYFISLCKGN